MIRSDRDSMTKMFLIEMSRTSMSELKIMDLVSILFYFIFILFSLILYCWVEDKEDKVWHHHRSHDIVTQVTHSHDAREQCKRS